jgi:chromate transporter
VQHTGTTDHGQRWTERARAQHVSRSGDPMPSLTQIAIVFTRYANLTLGGGSATAATMHRELVVKRRWLTEDQFTLSFALGRITPGTNLLAFCTGFGWALRGPAGAIVALLASSIPCAVLVAALTALLEFWRDSSVVQAAIHGAVAAAVGITVKTCWTIARPYFNGEGRLRVILVGGVAFLLSAVARIPPIEVLVLAAVIGAFLPVRGNAPAH